MENSRVAIVGPRGIFAESLARALELKPGLCVGRFRLDDDGNPAGDLRGFEPEVVVSVERRGPSGPSFDLQEIAPEAALVTLDAEKPTMGFSYEVRQPRATLECVTAAIRAVQIIRDSRDIAERRRREDGQS